MNVLPDENIYSITGVHQEGTSGVQFLCGQVLPGWLRAQLAVDVLRVTILERVDRIEVGVNHLDQLEQRQTFQLAHREHPVVESRVRSRPEGKLKHQLYLASLLNAIILPVITKLHYLWVPKRRFFTYFLSH